MCSPIVSITSSILSGIEIGIYAILIGFEIALGHWQTIYLPITIGRGVMIPFLLFEILCNSLKKFGLLVFTCVFRIIKFGFAFYLLCFFVTHARIEQ